jgi:xanthine dehydrogenase YagT iron-sulfur-binding subunit
MHNSRNLDVISLDRRDLLMAAAAAAAVVTAPSGAGAQQAGTQQASTSTGAPSMKVSFTVNGKVRTLELDTRTTLLDALREHLHMAGSKKGCDHGQCGACTVLVGGRRANACLLLAVAVRDEVTTIEGLADGEALHPMQQAFVEHDAFQCGYCTPGQICSAIGMLEEARRGWPSAAGADVRGEAVLDEAEIRERMSGNHCRCGAYANIVPAIAEASR